MVSHYHQVAPFFSVDLLLPFLISLVHGRSEFRTESSDILWVQKISYVFMGKELILKKKILYLGLSNCNIRDSSRTPECIRYNYG